MKASFLRRYRLAYYLKSTALTMPVLPIWWSEQAGVGLSIYLAGMAIQGIVSLAIDFPLSIWSDKTQPRIPYAVGLGVFALAFIATMAGGLAGFVGYLVCICLAGALISGADSALLMEITRDRFKTEIYELNRRFYLFTSGLFLLGVALYLISPALSFGVQALALGVAACLIMTLQTAKTGHSEVMKDSGKAAIGGNWRIKPTLTWSLVVVAICLAGGELEAVNQLLNRSLQILVAAVSIPGINGLWTVAGVLVLTNMLSALGLGSRARQLSEKSGLRVTLVALAVGALASLMFINSGILPVIVLGAIVMGMTKGVYRPLFTTLAVQTLPSAQWKARWLSVVGMLSSLVSSLVNVLIVMGDPPEKDIIWRMAIQMLCIVTPAVMVLGVARRLVMPLIHGGLSSKRSERVTELGGHRAAWLEQTYASPSHHSIPVVVRAQQASGLPHPQIFRWDDHRIEYEFIEGTLLEDIEPQHRWEVLHQQHIFAALEDRETEHDGDLPPVTQTQFAKECAQLCTCPAVSHGDLHPGNILVNEEGFVLIDWDQGGDGPRALDELALLTHPDLEAELEQRNEVFLKLRAAHKSDCPIHALTYKQVAQRVLAAKLIDIQGWGNSQTKNRLFSAYKKAGKSL